MSDYVLKLVSATNNEDLSDYDGCTEGGDALKLSRDHLLASPYSMLISCYIETDDTSFKVFAIIEVESNISSRPSYYDRTWVSQILFKYKQFQNDSIKLSFVANAMDAGHISVQTDEVVKEDQFRYLVINQLCFIM
ncbi:hypothetical protein HELRODRAFT_166169 [Helobdella robusta]|uniref:Uncharacterized protein n=1 Tax=Helobdella robusta TaxID=6412 RepID=T1EXV0_HELRO|nr:hypothetical protein HELRODRAFT_166169 [Helobdella robusta]ESN90498.1 hypothetical protein HELRODRAFT_166169 [Helobdella robusta]